MQRKETTTNNKIARISKQETTKTRGGKKMGTTHTHTHTHTHGEIENRKPIPLCSWTYRSMTVVASLGEVELSEVTGLSASGQKTRAARALSRKGKAGCENNSGSSRLQGGVILGKGVSTK